MGITDDFLGDGVDCGIPPVPFSLPNDPMGELCLHRHDHFGDYEFDCVCSRCISNDVCSEEDDKDG